MYIFIREIVFYYLSLLKCFRNIFEIFRNVSVSEPTETTPRNEILILGFNIIILSRETENSTVKRKGGKGRREQNYSIASSQPKKQK